MSGAVKQIIGEKERQADTLKYLAVIGVNIGSALSDINAMEKVPGVNINFSHDDYKPYLIELSNAISRMIQKQEVESIDPTLVIELLSRTLAIANRQLMNREGLITESTFDKQASGTISRTADRIVHFVNQLMELGLVGAEKHTSAEIGGSRANAMHGLV